jgi:outer membrane protein assembly factor BamB
MALLIVLAAAPARARSGDADADRLRAPKLPLAQWWSVPLEGPVGAGPVSDGSQVYVAFKSGDLAAHDGGDGHELWRTKKIVSAGMAASHDLLFVAAGDAVEALRAANGASAWVVPRVTAVAPLLLDRDLLFVVTETDVIAVNAATGEVRWRHPAGGVELQPAIDGDHVYVGANDGRVLALQRADGALLWEQFVPLGVSAIGAGGGRVYVGAGNKYLYCLDGSKRRDPIWIYHVGALPVGDVAVDDERVYFAAKDNTARGLDRRSGNQRWTEGLRERPTAGVAISGHVVFVAAAANQLLMLYDRNGRASGTLTFPGDQPPFLAPSVTDSPSGALVFVVTGSLANEWHLTKFAPAAEAALLPFTALDPLPGLPYLTDPVLKPLGTVLQTLLMGDPPLRPLAEMDFPVVLRDPPLVPLTVLPGLQLRPLSPVLPARRGAS